MAAITSIPKGSQISPATERVYHQSNLIGDWKGTWQKNRSPSSSRSSTSGAPAPRSNIPMTDIPSGGSAASTAPPSSSATSRSAPRTVGRRAGIFLGHREEDRGPQQGGRAGRPEQAGRKLERLFERQRPERVLPGRVRRRPGCAGQVHRQWRQPSSPATAIVYQNTVMFGSKAQFTTNDGQTGNVVFKIGNKSYSVPVTKNKPAASSLRHTVNKLA